MKAKTCEWPSEEYRNECCGAPAPYEAYVRYGPWNSCERHAREALRDGRQVDPDPDAGTDDSE